MGVGADRMGREEGGVPVAESAGGGCGSIVRRCCGSRGGVRHAGRTPRTACREDAEDAVHEALVRAVDAAHLSDEHLGAWLTTVTVRLCIDAHRRREREARAWARGAPP